MTRPSVDGSLGVSHFANVVTEQAPAWRGSCGMRGQGGDVIADVTRRSPLTALYPDHRLLHCRAEFFVDGAGWVPADPADVRKVALEEAPGGLPLDHPKVVAARAALFGGAEGNWIPYNTAHDLRLDGAAGPSLGFLMYPEAELAGTRLDCLDPDGFRYGIRARDVTA